MQGNPLGHLDVATGGCLKENDMSHLRFLASSGLCMACAMLLEPVRSASRGLRNSMTVRNPVQLDISQ